MNGVLGQSMQLRKRVWEQVRRIGRRRLHGSGWYGISHLDSAESFERWRKRVQAECEALRAEVRRSEALFRHEHADPCSVTPLPPLASSSSPHTSSIPQSDNRESIEARQARKENSRRVIALLDTISARLCLLLDTSEVCSSSHSDPAIRQAAQQTLGVLSEYVTKLNMDGTLYEPLRRIVDCPELLSLLTPEEMRNAKALRNEFRRDGIDLSSEEKTRVERLQFDVRIAEAKFGMLERKHASSIKLSLKESGRLLVDANVISRFGKLDTSSIPPMYSVPVDSVTLGIVLRSSSSGALRERFYKQAHSVGAQENLAVLKELVGTRHALANALGYESFADFTVSFFRMAKSPLNVMEFLEDLNDKVCSKAAEEARELFEMKQLAEGVGSGPLQAWDIPYYSERCLRSAFGTELDQVFNYFSVDNCLRGVELICKSLFGLRFEQVPMSENESWAPAVRKIQVREENGDLAGVLYLDLFQRAGKYPNPAHFQVRCSHYSHHLRHFLHSAPATSSGHGECKNRSQHNNKNKISAPPSGPTGHYQLPSSVLVCNFENQFSLLTHSQVQTFFHEFGHALHSLLSRTQLQHLSGTRGEMDFVETPSQLMEYFCWDERVLQQFAFHQSTGEPIPLKVVDALRGARLRFKAMEMQQQILFAACDQLLFSRQDMVETLADERATTEFLVDLSNRFSQVPHVEGTFWLSRFSHFANYGATYYSYTYARAFASDLWETCFKANPLDGRVGAAYRNNVLAFGGSKDPSEMLTSMLGRPTTLDALIHEVTQRRT